MQQFPSMYAKVPKRYAISSMHLSSFKRKLCNRIPLKKLIIVDSETAPHLTAIMTRENWKKWSWLVRLVIFVFITHRVSILWLFTILIATCNGQSIGWTWLGWDNSGRQCVHHESRLPAPEHGDLALIVGIIDRCWSCWNFWFRRLRGPIAIGLGATFFYFPRSYLIELQKTHRCNDLQYRNLFGRCYVTIASLFKRTRL